MKREIHLFERALVLLALLVCASLPVFARTHTKKSAHANSKQGKPAVEEVSPPNWWSGLPNPMLLLQGKNLTGADVSSSMAGISVRRTRVSANGHWMFVWLDISGAPPQRLNLIVHTSGGTVRVPFELDKRHQPTDGFQGFSSSDVMYLLMPDRFSDGDSSNDQLKQMPVTFDRTNPSAYHGGDLMGIENHLDYLQQLGVTTLWITPLYAQDPISAVDYSGYRPFDFYRVNPHFGALTDYENLAAALHARGMKFVLDLVMNHVSPKNPWVLDPPAPDWFHGTPDQHLEATTNFASIADPHASESAYRAPVHGWLANTLPDLNQSNPLVKQYLIQNAVWWIESGTLDGLRLDTFANVDREFWQEMQTELHALYPRLTAVGEIYSADPTVVSYFAGGVKHSGIDTGLYTPFDYPSYFALRASLTGSAPMTTLTDIERQDWVYPHPERLVTFFGNQDVPRFLSVRSAGASLPTAGAWSPTAGAARMKLAFGLLATTRGMPQIYYGDEIGLSGGSNFDNRQDFPGGFPGNIPGGDTPGGDSNDAFTAAGRSTAQESMHAWVAGLLQLRTHHDVLQTGLQQNLLADDTGLVYARLEALPAQRSASSADPGEIMLVLMNKSDAPRTFSLDFSHTALDGITTLTAAWNATGTVTVTNNRCDVNVAPEQLVVFTASR